jgi:hypothetical protein
MDERVMAIELPKGGQVFLEEVQHRCGENLRLCYQCLKCSVGCPTAPFMDFYPNAILRMIQLGLKMDALREMSLEEGYRAKERDIVTLHNAFMESIRRGGRVHEATMLMEYKLRSGDYWTDLVPGMKLFMKGKIPLIPRRIKGIDSIREIYEKTQKQRNVLRNRKGKLR